MHSLYLVQPIDSGGTEGGGKEQCTQEARDRGAWKRNGEGRG